MMTGLEMALDMGISVLKVFGDSQLVIRQMNGIYEVRKPELQAYHELATKLTKKFYNIQLSHVTRGMKKHADALAKLATALTLPPAGELNISIKDRRLLPSTLDLAAEPEEE